MTPTERCPECGGPLMAGSQAGMCARCLLAAALRHPVTAALAGLPQPGEWIGPYRLVRLLGEGEWAWCFWRNRYSRSPARLP